MTKKQTGGGLRWYGAILIMLVVGLAGCGGGGGGGSATTTGSTTTTTAPTPTVSLKLTDISTGAEKSEVTYGTPLMVSATVRDASGLAVKDAVVSFTVDATLARIRPSAGTALTNASGVATVTLDAASIQAEGAGTVEAKAKVNGADVTGSKGYKVGATNVGLTNMRAAQSPLSPYATTSILVDITGVPASTSMKVNFTSACVAAGRAEIDASVQSVNGTATATYKDKGCGIQSPDTITANVDSSAQATASIPLVVNTPGASSVQFVKAEPATIVLKGTGGAGLKESALVTFKLVDGNNQPVASANVTFDLTARTGGIKLDNTDGIVTKQTNAQGEVSVSVQSGTIPTSVWVTATVGALKTQSSELRISTGLAAQDRFSLSIETLNIEGWSIDGTKTKVSVIASDRLGNPVPDGTAINFISSGAQIQPTCATVSGACSVTFTSANPRPTTNALAPGRVRVVAYSMGEESFLDQNGNNVYDPGEPFNDLGNVIVDANENGIWDASEQFIVYGGNAQYGPYTMACAAPGISYLPVDFSQPATCNAKWYGGAHVRGSGIVVLSGSTAFITQSAFTLPAPACKGGFAFTMRDVNNNPMPAGTTLTVTGAGEGLTYEVSGPVINTSNFGGTGHVISLKIADDKCGGFAADTALLNIKTPSGATTVIPITISR